MPDARPTADPRLCVSSALSPGNKPDPAGPRRRPRRVLVTGSLAYDFIIDYPGEFKPKLAMRKNVRHTAVFPVDTLRREIGGCAGNISYTIAMLGGNPLLAAAVGNDGDAYLEHLRRHGIGTGRVRRFRDTLTAQAHIVNDILENQLIFFFPGAMDRAHELSLSDLSGKVSLAIVSPNGRQAMLDHAAVLRAQRIPFILDLGQGIGLFTGAELRRMLRQATYAVFNRMEFDEFRKVSGMARERIEASVEALVVTDSMSGSVIHAAGETYRISADVRGRIVDPTGCGDAYRGALIHAMLGDRSWPEAGRFASRVAGIKALSPGGQRFRITAKDLAGF